MTTTTWALVGLAALFAVVDWVAVGRANKAVEYVFKPATMVPLIVAAAAMHSPSHPMRTWFVVALVLSLAGDVFLMLPDQDTWFVPGLGSFLLGHLAYITGLLVGGVSAVSLAVGLVVIAMAIVVIAPRIVTGARRTDHRLAAPVFVYVLVISVMVACAIGSVVPAAIAGAALFYLSDFSIGWSKFVRDFPASKLVIIVTYHLAQILLVVSLASSR